MHGFEKAKRLDIFRIIGTLDGMKTTTIARILFGGAVILSCAVVPLWMSQATSSEHSQADLFVLPPDMTGPYEAVSPGAVWVYQQQFGSLFQETREGFESHVLKRTPLERGKDQVPLLIRINSKEVLPNQSPASPANVLGYLQSMVKPDEFRALVFPSAKDQAAAFLDKNHLLLHVLKSGDAEQIGFLIKKAFRGVVEVLLADHWYQFRSPGGDPGLAKLLTHTVETIGSRGPYAILSSEKAFSVDAQWLGFPGDHAGSLVSALTVPLAGDRDEITWLEERGFHAVAADSQKDLAKSLKNGVVSAGLLWEVPEGVSSATLPVSGYLSLIFNMKSRPALVLHRYVRTREEAKNFSSPAGRFSEPVRVLCRQSEGISRKRALALAYECEKQGIRIAIDLASDADFQKKLMRRDYDAVLGVFPLSLSHSPRYWWHSSSPGNISEYQNPMLDKLLDEAEVSGEAALLTQITKTLQENGPWVILEEVALKLCGSPSALRRLGFPATR